ncbi:hypothetical protein LTR62_000416 [Meristemomyces frigidus]|uniref:N-acetyltransferase domain-containing protein n=1 Tax=Meristemomyces frigidus TaxID=1508187 RepID=A0AAN7TPD3_9PEZI|nr:hypothetical protein LTR62_000416 [Meristemomyces frigidus]
MPLQVQPMHYDDIPAMATIDAAAMANWGLAIAMQNGLPEGQTREEFIVQLSQGGWDRGMEWVKVVDSELDGKLIAAALWRFQLEQETPKDESTAQAPGAEDEGLKPALTFPPVMAAMTALSKLQNDKYVHGQPHALLSVLVTDPQHQRRGAGTLLVKYGCDKADSLGLFAILHASPAGVGVYTKQGFEVIEEKLLDLRPFGVDESEVRRFMIREARAVGT